MRKDNKQEDREQMDAKDQDNLLVPAELLKQEPTKGNVARHRVIKCCIKKLAGQMSIIAKKTLHAIYY